MREALSYARNVLAKWSRDTPFRAWNEIGAAIDKCDAALAEPPDPIGNNAKMREALVKIASIDIGNLQEPIDGDSSAIYQNAKYDGKKFLGKEIPAWYAVGWYRSLKDAIDTAKAALSKPPRNCDIFTTGAKINEGIREWCRNHDCDKCPFLNDGCDSCYASWMLSTATEGGAK